MAESGSQTVRKPGKIALAAIYLYIASAFARTVTSPEVSALDVQYLMLEGSFLVLCTSMLWLTHPPRWLLHVYCVVQCLIVIALVRIYPQFDFVILLFIALSVQVGYFFTGRVRLVWAAALVLLSWGSMMYFNGFENSLWTTPTVIAAEIVILAYILVYEQVEAARVKSQAMLDELDQIHRKLELYTGQVEELVAEQERNRVFREIHDTVSQLLFSASLTARAAEMLLQQDSERAQGEIERLKTMTAEALSQLRSLIGQLRLAEQRPDDRS